MSDASLTELAAAHREIAALVGSIPSDALDWAPGDGAWSLKRTLAHVTNAYDFYIEIAERARAQDFGTVRLVPHSPGWRRLEATDAAVMACATPSEIAACLDDAHARAMALLQSFSTEDLDRRFTFITWRRDAQPEETTIRERVVRAATEHLREHQRQVTETLAEWQAASK